MSDYQTGSNVEYDPITIASEDYKFDIIAVPSSNNDGEVRTQIQIDGTITLSGKIPNKLSEIKLSYTDYVESHTQKIAHAVVKEINQVIREHYYGVLENAGLIRKDEHGSYWFTAKAMKLIPDNAQSPPADYSEPGESHLAIRKGQKEPDEVYVSYGMHYKNQRLRDRSTGRTKR